ncbi:GTP cyclohydrolase II [Marinagarivorans algicola]|uniref:GTP cyclohydrolase II n=1 Tax=Marinagarivorans algicola TaxID=1513270 RepID=UPI0006B92DEC|nr:GTP cyclohydrolase II [Marinagarivorans algicola]
MTITYVDTCKLPTPYGTFTMHGFADNVSNKEHVVLTIGDVATPEPVLARIHSECLTGDSLFSLRCDCGAQLQSAMQKIAAQGRGALFYLRQEGRGIGLLNKVKAYHLQDQGMDTVQANEKLGFAADMRDYSLLKPMVEHLGIQAVKLMTNNPRKIAAMKEIGLTITERLEHDPGRNVHNAHYLATKKGKLGHLFDE